MLQGEGSRIDQSSFASYEACTKRAFAAIVEQTQQSSPLAMSIRP